MTERARLEERLAVARRDLEELAEQEAAGEIAPEDAERLRATYRQELEEAETALASEEDRPPGPSGTRALIGWVLVVAALAFAVGFAGRSAVPRPEGGFITGGQETGRDLSEVTEEEMEAVITANPELTPMRLALADRYFEAGEFSRAAEHYLVVLEQEPATPQALARLGWMAFLSGEPQVGSRYVERAIRLVPEYAEAKWYLANIYLYGLERPAEAVPLLEELASLPDLPPDVAAAVEEMLAEARS